MGKHRKGRRTPVGGSHSPVRKVAAAVVAAGALAAVGQPLTANASTTGKDGPIRPLAFQRDLTDAVNGDGQHPASVQFLKHRTEGGPLDEAAKVDKSKAIERARAVAEQADLKSKQAAADAQRKAAEQVAKAAKPEFVKPADGTYTSGFGARWGSSHEGVDLANDIGAPIHAVTGGEVIDAGPATGFGQWIRMRHDDGTVSVYGHINTIDVNVGQKVETGEKIATMGNRGQSTGPHLHFEVLQNGEKVNPEPWLRERGISL